MQESSEFILAAEVVVLIIKNEGKIVNSIDYPAEFEGAFNLLLKHEVVQEECGEYVVGKNFSQAYKMGFQEFLDKLDTKTVHKSISFRKLLLGGISGVSLMAAVYFLKKYYKK